MDIFPDSFKVAKLEEFKDQAYLKYLSYLRLAIYEHVISHEETDYFSLDRFIRTIVNMKEPSMETIKLLLSDLTKELESLGWKCVLAYGNTSLFIYTSSDPPKNCWG
jgi:hypothetical protein